MAWNPQGGGKGPWGGGNNGGGGPWGQGGGGGGFSGSDLEDIIRRGQEKIRRSMGGGGGGRADGGMGRRGFVFLGVILLALWLGTGFYKVDPDEQGVVLRFGKWVDTTNPGLHYHLPYPIEQVLLPKVTANNEITLGFVKLGEGRDAPRRDKPEESRMLTGDENIVEADFSVQWRIKDAGQFLFNVRNPEGLVKAAAESVMRDVIGRNTIQSALSERRIELAQQAKTLLQSLLDSYEAGILITQVQLQAVDPPSQVIDAFNDVQRARADQERLRNQAEAYRNDILPRARGEAERMIQEAEAYKEEVINLAEGDAKRFLSVYEAYSQARDVTARRLYLETMEDILRKAEKVIIDPSAEGSGVVPYLPLPELKKAEAARRAGTQGGSQ